ncbi:hypothetical protein LMH73_024290 [Vibrio splendidus]|nr:hypothetical protein [Vibrio splendidus]MCC4880869.1 hypothetical protein [Vibrio splendidus]
MKPHKYILCFAALSSASINASDAPIGNLIIESKIANHCIVKNFNLESAGLTYSGKGQPLSKGVLTVYSNSKKPITFGIDYTGTNITFKNGKKLVPGTDVFFTIDGKNPIAKNGNVLVGKRDSKGNWNQPFHITTASGVMQDSLVINGKPHLSAQIRIRCPK